MRPNDVTEAGLPSRDNICFLTSATVVACWAIYLICLLIGYDSFNEICFLPAAIISKFQVYRIFTAILFHGSLFLVFFNMLVFVSLGSELERKMGSVCLLYLIVLLAITNAIFHLLIASVVAYNPFRTSQYLANECTIGFSGIMFSIFIIETSSSGEQPRSVFGLFKIPAIWYNPWLLLVVFQLLIANVSLLVFCGILSGYAYTYGLFNFLIPGTSFFLPLKRPLCLNVSSWIPQRETSTESMQGSSFPGRGRNLASSSRPMVPGLNSDSNLQARLLDDSNENHPSDGRHSALNNPARGIPAGQHVSVITDEQIQQPAAICFYKVDAADGDVNIAVDIVIDPTPGMETRKAAKSVGSHQHD